MKKNLFKVILSIIVLSFCIKSNAFAEQEISLKINGENSKIKPIVVNGSAMLPLRDILNVVGCDSIRWNQKTSTVTIVNGNMTIKLTPGKKKADVKFSFDENENEWFLKQPAFIRNGKIYIPLQFIEDVFFGEFKYENKTVFFNTPFKYVDYNWYEADSFKWKKVFVNNKTTKKYNSTIYTMFTTGRESLWMNPSALFALNAAGDYKLVSWMPELVSSYHVSKNNLYYQYNTSVLGGYDVIEKINLSDADEKVRLGRDDFSYGSKIVIGDKIDLGNNRMVYDFQREAGSWEVQSDGVYAVGFAGKAIVEGTIRDLSLLKESYGYYLLDEKGNHMLVKKLKI